MRTRSIITFQKPDVVASGTPQFILASSGGRERVRMSLIIT